MGFWCNDFWSYKQNRTEFAIFFECIFDYFLTVYVKVNVIFINFTMERERSFKNKIPPQYGVFIQDHRVVIYQSTNGVSIPNLQWRMDNYKGTGAKKIG